MDWNHAGALLLIAFVCNLPLGKWRTLQRRLSPGWFVAIHLSIPLVIFLRIYWQLPNWLIPLGIGVSVLAQFLGGALRPEWFPAVKKRLALGGREAGPPA